MVKIIRGKMSWINKPNSELEQWITDNYPQFMYTKPEFEEKYGREIPNMDDDRLYLWCRSDIGDGWAPTVKALITSINSYLERDHVSAKSINENSSLANKVPMPERKSFKIDQIKEKLGTLRFYCSHDSSGADEFIFGMIAMAETVCNSQCYFTGKPGKLENVDGWMITVCPEELERLKKERETS